MVKDTKKAMIFLISENDQNSCLQEFIMLFYWNWTLVVGNLFWAASF